MPDRHEAGEPGAAIGDTGPAPADDAGKGRRRRARRGYAEAFGTWVSPAAALIALVMSVYSFVVVRSHPEITVILPDMIRIGADSNSTYTKILMQPVIAIPGETQQAETVTGITMHLQRQGSGAPGDRTDFLWYASGRWQGDVSTGQYGFIEENDSAPFLVTRDKPSVAIMSFRAENWFFRPGTYRATLKVHRVTTSSPLTIRWCISLTARGIAQVDAHRGYFLPIRNDWPATAGDTGDRSCYRGQPPAGPSGGRAPSGSPSQAGTPPARKTD